MIASNGAVAARAASASGNVRPGSGRVVRALPVALPGHRDWNERVERWAAAA